MNKMKCFSAALVAFFLPVAHLCAQDIEKDRPQLPEQLQKKFRKIRLTPIIQ